MDSWTNGGSNYPYCSTWILTLKRIYAEGLRQRGIEARHIGYSVSNKEVEGEEETSI